jgi:hypothetical protein
MVSPLKSPILLRELPAKFPAAPVTVKPLLPLRALRFMAGTATVIVPVAVF